MNGISGASMGAALPGAAPGAASALEGGGTRPAGGPHTPFTEVWNKIQAQYGEKPKETRGAKKQLDKDDFLKIMITQMQHQDPTKPFDADKMAAELAQITSVEQMRNMNQSLEKMASREHPLERLAMTSMIGKTVSIDQRRFPHTKGENTALSFKLPEEAAEVKISIVDDAGKPVFEKMIGAKEAGEISYMWDGRKSNTLAADSGTYTLAVDAKGASGRAIDTAGNMDGRVVGVSFQGAEPVFLVGDPSNPSKVTMRNIVRIEEGSGSPVTGAAPQAPAGPKPRQMFTFTKGEGSKALAPGEMTPELAEALRMREEKAVAEAQASAPGPAAPPEAAPAVEVQEQGFPNGLDDMKGGDSDG